ncbi:MAG: glycosyltransferase family 4 protein [Candidatus Latescibacterota bacterium]
MIDEQGTTEDRRPSFCLVAHNAAGAMFGGHQGHIGGVERQTSLMARWLAARGYGVSVLTWDEGQADEEIVDGVRVIKMCSRDSGLPGLRFFQPRWTSLNRALRRADADVYYHNCAEYVTGQIALWCRHSGRKFVYSSASDLDCIPGLPDIKKWRVRVLYRYGLHHADRIVVQTRKQQSMLLDGFGLESTVLPMPCPGPSSTEFQAPEPPRYDSFRILWVGRICPWKCPERLLELARLCPEIHFDVVGPADDSEYAKDICNRARTLPNLTLHGAMPRERMPGFYKRAACLCCTSVREGFPNTFLEAWSHGLPVVSTFDPDQLIAERRLGMAAVDAAGLAAGIRQLIESPGEWRQISVRARRYYVENHTLDAVMPRFIGIFLDALSDGRAQAGASAQCGSS